jgi:hypothetical protein
MIKTPGTGGSWLKYTIYMLQNNGMKYIANRYKARLLVKKGKTQRNAEGFTGFL